MRLDYTAETREKGGLGMPELKTRMKPFDIMWLKKFLNTPDKDLHGSGSRCPHNKDGNPALNPKSGGVSQD